MEKAVAAFDLDFRTEVPRQVNRRRSRAGLPDVSEAIAQERDMLKR